MKKWLVKIILELDWCTDTYKISLNIIYTINKKNILIIKAFKHSAISNMWFLREKLVKEVILSKDLKLNKWSVCLFLK